MRLSPNSILSGRYRVNRTASRTRRSGWVRLSAIPPVTLGLEGVCFPVSQFHIHTSVQVIVNGRAGRMAASKSRDDLTALIKAVYTEATVIFTTEARDVPKLARDAVKRGSTLIVAGGGDGTINAVASVLV